MQPPSPLMPDYAQTYRDGYDIKAVATRKALSISVTYSREGRVVDEQQVWCRRVKSADSLPPFYPEWHRRQKLLKALLRAANEGAELDELLETCKAAQDWVEQVGAVLGLSLAALAWEETHARTFDLANGNYLRIMEFSTDDESSAERDGWAEELTPEQMLDIARAENRLNTEDDDLLGDGEL